MLVRWMWCLIVFSWVGAFIIVVVRYGACKVCEWCL